jgi:hypothetical protein
MSPCSVTVSPPRHRDGARHSLRPKIALFRVRNTLSPKQPSGTRLARITVVARVPGRSTPRRRTKARREIAMPLILWLLGVPLSLIVILWLIGVV